MWFALDVAINYTHIVAGLLASTMAGNFLLLGSSASKLCRIPDM